VPDGPTGLYQTDVTNIMNSLYGFGGFQTVTGALGNVQLQFVHWSKKYATASPFAVFEASPKWATLRKRGSFGRANSSPI
jgi:hypothetical protein